MGYLNNVKEAIKEVYSQKSYLIIGVLFAFFIFSFSAVVNNYKILIQNFSFALLFALIKGASSSMAKTALLFLSIMSILAGIVFSMSVFITKRQIKGNVGVSSSSLFVSLIAPACPSCAIGLLSTLGFGGLLAVLPFKGLELGVVGIILLVASVIYLSQKVVTKTCKLKIKSKGENHESKM